MKKIKLIIFLLSIWTTSFSQVVFNKIVEDTLNHVTSGVIDIDTGYILVTGSRNEHLIRCFALRYIDNNGNCVWKKTYTDDISELWEGYNNTKTNEQNTYIAGSGVNTVTGNRSIFLQTFSEHFEQNLQKFILDDSNWKIALDQIYLNYKYYIVGQIYDVSSENYRLMLVKTNDTGELEWTKTFGNDDEAGDNILCNSDGDLIIGGLTTGFSPTIKWYIIKTDTSGNLIWEKAFGHNTRNNGSVGGIIETQDLNILACGAYPAAIYGSGDGEIIWDACLRKIDTNGNLLWERLYRNYSCHPLGTNIKLSGSFKTVLELDNGDLMLCGSSQWYYTILRGYLIKTDSEGNIKWKRYYYADDYTSTWQYFSSIKATSDKGFIIAGYGDDYSNLGYDPPQQAWLVKTDSLGMDGLCNVEPDELNFDFDILEVPEGICMNDTIQVYVHIAGKSAPYTIEFSTGQVIDSIYYPPTFVPVEIGLTDINLEWGGETYFEESITEATLSNHEWGQCIVKPVEFYTPNTWGPQQLQITVTDAYGESLTITKEIFAVQCTSENISVETNGFKLYPNPSTDNIYVEIPENLHFSEIEIFNTLGQIVMQLPITSGQNIINVKSLPSGSYFVRLTDDTNHNTVLTFDKK